MTDIKFDVKNDIAKTLAKFPWVNERNYAVLASNVINSTAYKVTEELKKEMPRAFDRPTPYALRAIYPWRSTPDTLHGEVRVRDEGSKGTPAIRFLGPEIAGGARGYKRSERALQAKGILPQGMYTAPTPDTPLDQYGNIKRGYLVQVLSGLRAFGEQGYLANRTTKSAGRGRRAAFFVINKPGRLPMGIYERRGKAFRMTIAFIKAPKYPKRLRYFEIADTVARSYFPDKLRREAEYQSAKNGAVFKQDALDALGRLLG